MPRCYETNRANPQLRSENDGANSVKELLSPLYFLLSTFYFPLSPFYFPLSPHALQIPYTPYRSSKAPIENVAGKCTVVVKQLLKPAVVGSGRLPRPVIRTIALLSVESKL
jgi:hypothetical protein